MKVMLPCMIVTAVVISKPTRTNLVINKYAVNFELPYHVYSFLIKVVPEHNEKVKYKREIFAGNR